MGMVQHAILKGLFARYSKSCTRDWYSSRQLNIQISEERIEWERGLLMCSHCIGGPFGIIQHQYIWRLLEHSLKQVG
jgi:hypothetical protein